MTGRRDAEEKKQESERGKLPKDRTKALVRKELRKLLNTSLRGTRYVVFHGACKSPSVPSYPPLPRPSQASAALPKNVFGTSRGP